MLVNRTVILAAFGFSLLAWWLKADTIAVLLLTLSAVGLISHLWGMAALKNLEAFVETESTVLSVGRSARVTYKIENNKMLPLVWLEICQDVPKNACMEPDGTMTLRNFSEEEAAFSGKQSAYMRRFAFLMGHSTLTWSCSWTGKRRGVYRPADLTLRSGDGFGLTQSVCEVPGLKEKVFVVWPRIVPVQTSFLLKNLWSGRTGKSGWTEDITILRDEREYQSYDSWKRIDWRTAARTDELYTKQFERIRPQSILLVVESGSFSDPEEALSIAASLIFELSAQGVAAGLALPATKEKDAVLIRPDDPARGMQECMFELADHDVSSVYQNGFLIRKIYAAAEESGQVWILGEDRTEIMNGSLYAALCSSSPGLLTAKEEQGCVSFLMLRKEEGQ